MFIVIYVVEFKDRVEHEMITVYDLVLIIEPCNERCFVTW
jgi:hypothetical protein